VQCKCGSEAFQKFGTYLREGVKIQRFKCKSCGDVFSDTSARPLLNLRVPFDQALRVVGLLVEGMGIRAASRVTGLHQQTVLNILETVGAKCASLLDRRVRGVSGAVIECDELYSYVGCRPENASRSDPNRGDIFGFVATDRNTKLIVSFLLGKRTKANAVDFIQDLRGRVTGAPQISTDGLNHYCAPRTGAIRQVFGNDVTYGIEIKTLSSDEGMPGRYTPAKVTGVRRIKCIGNPESRTIGTSRIERLNLSMRHFNKRFARATPCYSKKIENHRHAFALFAAHFNFCRCHSSLKNGVARTPATASGLTDRPWTIEELLKAE